MKIETAALATIAALEKHVGVFTFGNGGSASIANHMACDWMKGTEGSFLALSLASNLPLITAIANDLGYEHTCSKQLEWFKNKQACVLLISSSGTSPNIVKAAETAKEMGYFLIGYTGNAKQSKGGKLRALSDVSVHCDSTDYGVIEDYHSQVMHEVARQIRGEK